MNFTLVLMIIVLFAVINTQLIELIIHQTGKDDIPIEFSDDTTFGQFKQQLINEGIININTDNLLFECNDKILDYENDDNIFDDGLIVPNSVIDITVKDNIYAIEKLKEKGINKEAECMQVLNELLNADFISDVQKEEDIQTIQLCTRAHLLDLSSQFISNVAQNNKDNVKLLLAAGANVNARAKNGRFAAVSNNDKDYLLDANVSAFYIAVYYGYVDMVKMLLQYQPDINMIYSNGYTVLMVAINKGYKDVVKILLDAKDLDVNIQGVSGMTALIWACQWKQQDVVTWLLEAGAEVNIKNEDDKTALISATHSSDKYKVNENIVQMLLQAGADANVQPSPRRYWENYALIKAAEEGNANVVKMLLDAGADRNVIGNKYGETALIAAAKNGNAEVVKMLLDANADVNIQDKNGYTALMMAVIQNRKNVVRVLLDANAEVNTQLKDSGWTALHMAIQRNDVNVVTMLLEAGADPNIKDSWGKTADSYAPPTLSHSLSRLLSGMFNSGVTSTKRVLNRVYNNYMNN